MGVNIRKKVRLIISSNISSYDTAEPTVSAKIQQKYIQSIYILKTI